MDDRLTKDQLTTAVAGSAAALRCRRTLQPAGGPGDKVFPPTYSGAVYAIEHRRIRRPEGGEDVVPCVLLDSVQSQANRMEEALQEAVDEERVRIPVIEVRFPDEQLLQPVGRVTSLQAPHRIADAILRDSLLDNQRFPESSLGKRVATAALQNATPLYELCPTALLLGMWDSTGPRGGLGPKFQRALVSEIVGIGAAFGTKTSSRIDPLQIRLNAGPVYRAATDKGLPWTTDEAAASKDAKGNSILWGKKGKPSEVNHGNVVPSLSDTDPRSNLPLAGGVTVAYAEQTTVLSLAALRRLRFPDGAGAAKVEREVAARVVLAALGLCASALAAEKGLDLRSRCLLWPDEPADWELLDLPGQPPAKFRLEPEDAIKLLTDAVAAARRAGVEWREEVLTLDASPELVRLVRKSQELAIAEGTTEATAG
jgi:CRISPR-associated protein Csb1